LCSIRSRFNTIAAFGGALSSIPAACMAPQLVCSHTNFGVPSGDLEFEPHHADLFTRSGHWCPILGIRMVYLQGKLPLATRRCSFIESTTSNTITQRKHDIIHQRRGYLGEWANADKIDLLILLLILELQDEK
jgi:hypothetical protein